MVTISARNDIHSYLVPVGHSLQAVMLARRPSHYVNELADKSSRQPALIFYCQPLFLPLSFSLSPKGPFLLRQHAIKKRTSAILLSRPQGPLIFRCHAIKRTSAILLPPFPPLFASARESGYLPCPKRQKQAITEFFWGAPCGPATQKSGKFLPFLSASSKPAQPLRTAKRIIIHSIVPTRREALQLLFQQFDFTGYQPDGFRLTVRAEDATHNILVPILRHLQFGIKSVQQPSHRICIPAQAIRMRLNFLKLRNASFSVS